MISSNDAPSVLALPAPDATPETPIYEFIKELTAAMRNGHSRSIILSGNVQDLFYSKAKSKEQYVPLVSLLIDKFSFDKKVDLGGDAVDLAIIHLDLNDGIRFVNGCEKQVVDMFVAWQVGLKNISHLPTASKTPVRKVSGESSSGSGSNEVDKQRKAILDTLYANLRDSRNNNATALQILRRFVEASQFTNDGPKLLILIEGADLIVPSGIDVGALTTPMVRKLGIMESWFSDPDFMEGKSTVIALADALPAIHPRVSRLPQILNIEVPSPNYTERLHYIHHHYINKKATIDALADKTRKIAEETASLSLQSIRQLLIANLDQSEIPSAKISNQVAAFIKSQLGESIKFYKPNRKLDEIRGNRKLKAYAKNDLIPWLESKDGGPLPTMIFTGPIGGGKTVFVNALASEVQCPVLELGNIRSQWYGGTDIILDKLERLLKVIPKVVIIVPEADTAFGGVGKDSHETERRLTGKIQSLMSDPDLRRKVMWILDTARVDQLSPDMRRPGRVDVIIPMFDPDDEDRKDFVAMISDILPPELNTESEANNRKLMEKTVGFSASLFGAIRDRVQSKLNRGGIKSFGDVLWIVDDTLLPDITATRKIQECHALLNCTSRSLLPDKYQEGDMNKYREEWTQQLKNLQTRPH